MLRELRRLVSAAVAIALGVAFVAATLLLGSSLAATMHNAAAAGVGDATTVVARPARPGANDKIGKDLAAAVRAEPGVSDVRVQGSSYQPIKTGKTSRTAIVAIAPPLSKDTRLVAGAMPASGEEAAVSELFAQRSQIAIGDTLSTLGAHGAAHALRVTGIVAPGRDAVESPDAPYVWVPEGAYLDTAETTSYDDLLVRGSGGDALTSRITALAGATGGHLVVRSGAAEIEQRAKDLTQGVDVMRNLLLAFAAIAVFVAALVIANTFSITVAQRTKSLALLRCLGATRAQVFRSVLTEALILGAASSVVGIALGAGLAAIAIALSHSVRGLEIDALAPTPATLVVPLLAGIVVTLLAAWWPARAATRVAPLAALRPQLAAPGAGRAGIARVVAGAVLFLGGLALLAFGALRPLLVAGIAGGVLSFVGFMVLGPVLIPAAVGLLGAPIRRSGVPGDLAVENSRRNPRRAAATASALLVGVTLITMMSVGAQSAQATEQRAMEREFPTDAQVMCMDAQPPADLAQRVRDTPGVARAAAGHLGPLEFPAHGKPSTLWFYAIDAHDSGIFRQPSSTKGLRDGAILLDKNSGVADGTKLDVTIGGVTRQLTASVDRDHLPGALITETTLAQFTTADAHPVILVRYNDGASAWTVLDELQSRVQGNGITVEGSALGRSELQKVIDVILYIVTGLLAVSVLIALVGVSNTLALSILERTQESGLLRALGLTRTQLRRMIGIESVTLAVTAVVLGLLLGTAYGVAGIYALLKGHGTIVIAVPWLRLAIVSGVAILAGWLASVMPSLRAARVAPSAALATE